MKAVPLITAGQPFSVFANNRALFYSFNCMEIKQNKESKLILDTAVCAAWSLFVLIVTGCRMSLMNPATTVILVIGFAGLSYLILKSEKNDKNGRIIAVVTILAIAVRTFYVLYTGAEQRQHDMGEFDTDLGLNYHAEYIEYLLENHRLMNEDIRLHWQFYHPPLQHIISAVFIAAYRKLAPGLADNWDALQALSLFYSLVTLAVAKRFAGLWKLSSKGTLLAYLTIAFHSDLIVFAGSLNNDPLSVMFAVAALYLALVWYNDEKKSFLKLMGMSLCIGLGMMAKLSAGIIAVPVAFIMLKAFFESKNKLRYVWQYTVFLIVCAPLGLWYQIRSYVLWKVPLTYVAVPDIVLNPGLVIEEMPFWKRFFSFGEGVDYNIISETLDSAVFDADYYRDHTLLAVTGYLLLAVFTVLTITVLANFIVMWIKERGMMNLVMTFLLAAELISYVSLCFKMPYTCTMSFRYIAPTIIAGAYYSGMSADKSPRLLSMVTGISVYGFAFISLVFYSLVWLKG